MLIEAASSALRATRPKSRFSNTRVYNELRYRCPRSGLCARHGNAGDRRACELASPDYPPRLKELRFVGMDIVEVAAAYCVAEITALAGATIVWEYLALLGISGQDG
jgi:hypothetical protein